MVTFKLGSVTLLRGNMHRTHLLGLRFRVSPSADWLKSALLRYGHRARITAGVWTRVRALLDLGRQTARGHGLDHPETYLGALLKSRNTALKPLHPLSRCAFITCVRYETFPVQSPACVHNIHHTHDVLYIRIKNVGWDTKWCWPYSVNHYVIDPLFVQSLGSVYMVVRPLRWRAAKTHGLLLRGRSCPLAHL